MSQQPLECLKFKLYYMISAEIHKKLALSFFKLVINTLWVLGGKMQKWTEENILKPSTRDFLKVPLKISLQFKITKHIEKKIQP